MAPLIPRFQAPRRLAFAMVLVIAAWVGTAPAHAAEPPGEVSAACELTSSGVFSFSVRGEGGSDWILSVLAPAGETEDPRSAFPPFALKAGFALGPLFLGSLVPPEELARLKDPLSGAPCPSLDSKTPSASGIALDTRELAAGSKPGFQDAPGFAVDLKANLRETRAADTRILRFKAGVFPVRDLPLLGAGIAYSASSKRGRAGKIGWEADIAALVNPLGIGEGTNKEEDDAWFRDGVPALPRDVPILLGKAGLRLILGPFASFAGLIASNGAAASPALSGEAGMLFDSCGLRSSVAAVFPLRAEGTSASPFIAFDGSPSGAAEWAEAGIDRSWRWEASWKGGPGLSFGAEYRCLTGLPLARSRSCLPRREKLDAKAGIEREGGGFGLKAGLECGRTLDWKTDGQAEAENGAKASLRGSFAARSRKGRAPISIFIGGYFSPAMKEARANGPGDEGALLILAPGAMPRTELSLAYGAECGVESGRAALKVSLALPGGEKDPELSVRAECALPRSGRAFLEIGPGDTASIGWKSR